jgi:hypothetical protein
VRGGPPLSTVLRRDRWWVQPALTVFGLTAFVVYSTWAAFRNGHYYVGFNHVNGGRDYLSPLYSPCLTHNCQGYVWGPVIGSWWSISPAILILIFPLAFRATCYYYRKAYYRSFWLSPPACAVADAGSQSGARKRYTGETRFPLVIQNIHRYTWYFALAFAAINVWDAIAAFRFPDGIGMGLGTIILIVNGVLLSLYTLGCHACRHLCGGGLRRFSTSPLRHVFWAKVVSPLNAHHQLFAWLSLVWIAWTDFYVYLVATGALHDPRFF